MPGFDSGVNYSHEWKEEGSLDQLGLLEKKMFGQVGHFGPQNGLSS